MSSDHTVGIKLNADASGLSGALRLSREELQKLAMQAQKSGKDMGPLARGASLAARQMDKLHNTGSRLKSSLFSLKSAVAGVGLDLMAKSFLDAASTSESFRVRLEVLLGSAREGNRLFQEMADYAGRVPFEYREIMGAATQLSGIMAGGVDEISAWMPLIGDLAATSGLSIATATEQITRMLSSGAASADMFREKGILSMLGFQAGVSVSAEETRDRLIAAWTDTNSKFRGATDKLSRTWEGTMSMLKNKWFAFRNDVMDAGLFDYLKSLARTLNDDAGKAMEDNKDMAKTWSDAAISGIEMVIKALGVMLQVWNKIYVGLKTLQLGFESIKFAAISAYNLLPRSGFESQAKKQAALDQIDQKIAKIEQDPYFQSPHYNRSMKRQIHHLRGQRKKLANRGMKDYAAQDETAASMARLKDELNEAIYNPKNLDADDWIQRAREGVKETGEAADKSADQIAALNKEKERLVKVSSERRKAIQETADKASETLDEELQSRKEARQKSLQDLIDSHRTEKEAEKQRHQDTLALLEQSEKDKTLSVQKSNELRQKEAKKHQDNLQAIEDKAGQEQRDKAKAEAKKRADQIPEPFKNALRDIQGQFTSFFENVFRGGVNSFGDLAKAVKNIFIKLAANLATLRLFEFAKGRLAGAGGQVGALAGLLGVSGGASASGGSGTGSLFSSAGDLGSLFGGSKMNTTVNAFGAKLGFATPGTLPQVVTGINGEVIGTIGSKLPTSGSLFGNVTLGGAVAGAGAGFLGRGLAGSLLGSSGVGADVGGGIGGAAGFAIGGPIGAGIGSFLGSAIGGLFGNNQPSDKAQGIDLTASGTREWGLTGKKFSSELRQTADGIGKELQSAAKAIEEQIGAKLSGRVRVKLGQRDGNYVTGSDGIKRRVQGDEKAIFHAALKELVKQVQGGDKKLLSVLKSSFAKGGDINQALSAVSSAKAVSDQIKGLTAENGPLVALGKRFDELKKNAAKYGLSLGQVNQAHITSINQLKDQTRLGLQQIAGQAQQLLNIDSLKQFRQSLSYSETAPLSPLARFNEAKALLDKEARAALGGDIDAGNRFPQLAQQVLQLGRATFASGSEYGELFKDVNTTLNEVIGSREATLSTFTDNVNIQFDNSANKQIEALREMKDALLEQEKKAENRLVEIREEIKAAEDERRHQEEAAAAARARQEKEIVRGHDVEYWRGRYAGVRF